MEEKIYSVSEAVRLVGVESHVLRYWEEELKVPIRRTSLGHRVYSEQNIETFCQVREWKRRGLQLKAIRVLLDGPEQGANAGFDEHVRTIAYASEAGGQDAAKCEDSKDETMEENTQSYEIIPVDEARDDLEKVVAVLKQMMEEVVEEQNRKLEQQLKEDIRDEIETMYLQYIQMFQEAAAAKEPDPRQMGRLKQLLRRLFS